MTPPDPDPGPPPPFDEAAVAAAVRFAEEALAAAPEVRGVAVLFDYTGRLNDSARGAAWVTRSAAAPGAAALPAADEAVGMGLQAARFLGTLADAQAELVRAAGRELTAAQQALVDTYAGLAAVRTAPAPEAAGAGP